MRVGIMSGLRALVLASLTASQAFAQTSPIVVKSEAELPRLSYPINGSAASLLGDPARRSSFATKVRDGDLKMLATTKIADRATLRSIHKSLLSADLLLGDNDKARAEISNLRDLQDKPAAKLLSGIEPQAWLDSLVAGAAGSPAQIQAYQVRFASLLAPMPWAMVADEVHSMASDEQIFTPSMIEGVVAAQLQSAIDKTGALDRSDADRLIYLASLYMTNLPVAAVEATDLKRFIALNDHPKPDIWSARAAWIPAGARLTPVVIGIWDSGVDPKVYPERMWAEASVAGPTGAAHGIGYDVEFKPSSLDLEPVPVEYSTRLDEARDMSAGELDMQAGIDSPAADAARAKFSKLDAAQIKSLVGLGSFYDNYAHGTHVAGIASDGNPAAKVLLARIQFDDRLVPSVPTMERAKREAQAFSDTVAFMKKAHVRVVNMSWLLSLRDDYEAQLEAAGVPEPQRSEQARAQFAVVRAGLLTALQSAPDILFVCAAGNTNDDNDFGGVVPSSFGLPNLLTVGAVDQAGTATSFTTSGKNVLVYADGFQVPSHVPGGSIQKWSGTSMASPQVVNLAAKLFAMHPEMSAAAVKSAIIAHAAPVQPGGPVLINPKLTLASVE